MTKIPVSVVITTRNEEHNIARCLDLVQGFSQIIVVDSNSSDKTCDIACGKGAEIVSFNWNGKYPKKRGWCLENLNLKYDWVFWVDADEVLTTDLVREIRLLFKSNVDSAGFFIKGQYVWNGSPLRHGLQNNKLALINRHKLEFPVIDDLNIEGMREMEGHYQPVFKNGISGKIGQLKSPFLHYAYDNQSQWLSRHKRYAHWEAEVTKCGAWGRDPVFYREILKKSLRRSYFRPYVMFIYSYILKLGFLDGENGFEFALSRKKYCDLILKALK